MLDDVTRMGHVERKMAASKEAVKLSEVTERRLRPVYDAIDNGQLKKAAQLASKILKKDGDLVCAKALKGLALHRLGRVEEGRALLEEAKERGPADEPTLQAMTLYYRETGQFEKVCEIYAAAAKAAPHSEEILTHLFMAYVRVGDYQRQQQTALALHKVVPNNPYYFWGVMSIVMQARMDPTKAKTMFLPLAQRMVERFIKEGKLDAEAEVKLYLMILERLGSWEKTLEVLKAPLGKRIHSPEEWDTLLVDALVQCRQWSAAVAKLQQMLEADPDQWSDVKTYIACQIKRYSLREEGSDGEGALGEAKDFIEGLVQLQEKGGAGRRVRGPYLARLELLRQLKEAGLEAAVDLGLPDNHMFIHFLRFGSKPCCYDDLSTFIPLLTAKQKAEFLKEVRSVTKAEPVDYTPSDEDLKKNLSRLHQHTNLLLLERFSGEHLSLSSQEKRSLASTLLQKYREGIQLGRHLASTEWQPSDTHLLVTAHLLLEVGEEEGGQGLLWEAALELEEGRRSSPSNHQITLLLFRVYAELGVFEKCAELYDNLDVKQIQIDTVGYLPRRYMISSGTLSLGGVFFGFGLKFYFNARREMSEFLIQAYKNGSFQMVVEMTNLRDRLFSSHLFALLQVQQQLLALVRTTHSLSAARESADKLFRTTFGPNIADIATRMVDNRDVLLLDDWGPPEQRVTIEQVQHSFQLECLFFRFLAVIMQGLKSLLLLPALGGRRDGVPAIATVVDSLEAVLKDTRQHPTVLSSKDPWAVHILPIQRPPICEIVLFVSQSYDKALLSLFRVAQLSLDAAQAVAAEAQIKEHLETALEVLRGCSVPTVSDECVQALTAEIAPDGEGGDGATRTHPMDVLKEHCVEVQPLSLFTQVVAVVTLLCDCASDSLAGGSRPDSTSLSKKQKKKQQKAQIDNPCVHHLVWFVRELKQVIDSHCSRRKSLPKSTDIAAMLGRLSLTEKSPEHQVAERAAAVYNSVAESYNTSFSECTAALQHKSEQLATILARWE